MPFARKNYGLLSLLIVLSMLLAPIVEAAELSLFQRLKLKTQQKAEQLQQKEWWITKAVSKAVGFVAGKAGGAVGAAVGYVIGAGLGGPVAAGMGAMIGFRIGDIVTKTFAKAISELVTQWKLRDQRPVNLGTVIDAVKTVNKASLSAESVGAVLGDLIGGSLGAAAGIAMLAGTGPIALPIIGTLSAAYLGSKLGKAIFGGIGRWIGRKTLKKGYEALAADEPEETPEEAALEKVPEISSAGTEAAKTAPAKNSLQARQVYEQAYKEYIAAVTSKHATEAEKQEKLRAYQQALKDYQVPAAQQSR
ncbi:MAG: hypothetical protein AB1403_17265 [Candidatus Riflebacteria bacterium]